MEFTRRIELDIAYEDAIGRVKDALKDQGFAHGALEIDPRIAALLPCNVVVRTEQGRTVVEALDPKIIAEVPDKPALAPIAKEASERIQAALDALQGNQ